jgi:hypothetical protein
VILYANYATTNGDLVFAMPVVVVSRPPGTTLSGIELDPPAAALSIGDTLPTSIWGDYTNGTRSLLYVTNGQVIYSSSNTNVAGVDSIGTITMKSLGSATVTAAYSGFTGQIVVSSLAPIITSQPQSLVVNQDSNAVLSVVVTGCAPLSFQWRFNGINIIGATNRSLALTNVQSVNVGNYDVVACNLFGAVTSAPPAVLTAVPTSGLVSWWKGDGNASDSVGTNNGVLVGAVSFTNGVSGQAFLMNTGYVSVADSPSLSFVSGSPATFSVWTLCTSVDNSSGIFHVFGKRDGCSGGGVGINYQLGIDSSWPATPLNQWTCWTLVFSGSQLAVYINGVLAQTRAGFGSTNSAPFQIGQSGTCGGLFYEAIDNLRVYNRPLSPSEITSLYAIEAPPPVIVTSPTNRTVVAGSPATLAVVANGAQPLSYQWRFNGTNLAAATGTSLTISNAQLANAGNYQVVVTNAVGSATSSVATLTVAASAPVITGQPQSLTISSGQNVTLSVSAHGSEPLIYQWQFNGTDIVGGWKPDPPVDKDSDSKRRHVFCRGEQFSRQHDQFECFPYRAYSGFLRLYNDPGY